MERYTVKKIESPNDNMPCYWCDENAQYTIKNDANWTDHACKEHLQEWFPGAIPQAAYLAK
jgi:hypothetical protein